MKIALSEAQELARRTFQRFAKEEVAPHAELVDREERIPRSVVEALAREGYLASGLPEEFGGRHADPIVRGLMHEALGYESASIQGLVNVHHMATSALARWGTAAQKQAWLPRFTRGELLAAFALTEPNVGSDALVETTAEVDGDDYLLTGTKQWITCGAIADVFVLFARVGDAPTAFLVPANAEGFSRTPIQGILGCRGYMLARLVLDRCRVPKAHRIGTQGFGISHVMSAGLDNGRYNLAWSCVGQAQACLDASLAYTDQRKQFGAPLKDFQLIQRLLTRMIVGVQSARMLCWRAGHARAERLHTASYEAMIAKYQASTVLNEVANQALQIHGANGCGSEYPIQRYLRDARIMEIIEGSTQMLEIMIAKLGSADAAASRSA
ncbi:acyl-CoA dehydrogenase family protein [Polyangium jinanense]|uniref:Acyl-CoA dehydrogenase family protein n=1 Tax=Polyangium jinanense TaxID=2829994 RepID=A0A9X4AQS8_9BACT|nr:acyl-CoA dehydrogenase family protein [Polyangium jinanense]MDC3954373.1 acyl-CoA dehydrogenase family protein [Polyangium jinanense]MDC3980676.1 acyl-CoA dehydrogenase family protein [Polyangium jinanense]